MQARIGLIRRAFLASAVNTRSLRLTGLVTGAVVCSYVNIHLQSPVECQAIAVQAPQAQPPQARKIVPKNSAELVATPSSRLERFVDRLRKSVRYLYRLCQYLFYGIPLLSVAPIAYYCGDSPEGSLGSRVEDGIWRYLVWTLEQLGPTFVKFAQWASSRPDVFPHTLIHRLKRLQDDVTVKHSMSTVEITLREAFGDNWKEYLTLDPRPIGAGCVAQVFKGTLHMDGINKTLSSKVINSTTSEGKDNVKVAVKLIHPHVESLIRVDMDLLGYVADWFDRNEKLELLSVGDTCRQFAEMMREQLDLRVEASHLRKFVANFKNENWLVFPEPIDKFVCRNVLVETFVEGTPLKNIMEASPVTEELKRFKMKLSDLGTRAILKMLFFDNFIHGDLHPG
jgi:aarF domain-containing kinase